MKWKMWWIFLLAGISATGLTACDSTSKKELIVFAAASMTETLDEIAEQYEKINSDVEIIYNFDSSGILRSQIVEGAECDVFISASQEQMEGLKTEKEFYLVENKVVLAVAAGNPAEIESYQDLGTDRLTLIGLGSKNVPVGMYSEKILEFLGIREQLEQSGKITYGSNVKEVTTQIAEGSVDCGIIYATDASAAKLQVVDEAAEEMCGKILYPAAVLKTSKKTEVAREFLAYLKSKECSVVFERAGFLIPQN